jgi:hypothetical protein
MYRNNNEKRNTHVDESLETGKENVIRRSVLFTCMYSRIPLIRKLVIRTANYPERLGPSGKFVENSTKLP